MKFLSTLLILVCLISCKKYSVATEQKIEDEVVRDTLSLSKQDIAKIKYLDYGIDAKAKNTLDSWLVYNTISKAVENLKNADFDFFTEDEAVFASALEDLDTTIPEDIDTASIRARLLVLKTKLYKLEEATRLTTTSKQEHLLIIKEVFEAFSYVTLLVNKKYEKEAQNIIKPE